MSRCRYTGSRHTANSYEVVVPDQRGGKIQTQLLLALAIGVAIGFTSSGPLHHASHPSVLITTKSLTSTATTPSLQLKSSGTVGGGDFPKINVVKSEASVKAQGNEEASVLAKEKATGQPKSTAAMPTPTDLQGRKLSLVIATGANSAYFRGLKNMVGSVHYWCEGCWIVVYNLGLDKYQVVETKNWCRVTLKWKHGIKLQGPGSEHVKQPKQYAWKPFALLETVNDHRGRAGVLWIDAGSTITGPLMPTILPLLRDDGHFLVQGQDHDMTRLIHPAVYQYLNVSRENFVNKPSYAGNTVGFVYGSEGYHKILLPWTRCAGKPECIAPAGSSTANHRFDQTALSIVAYRSGMNITAHTELLLATSVECYKPHERVVWTSRAGETCYAKFAVCGTKDAQARHYGALNP